MTDNRRKSIEEQIKSGLRLGGGLGLFLIAAILLGDARTRPFFTPSHYQIPQSILLLTTHVWWLYIAGGVLFGVFKGLVAFMAGSDLFPTLLLSPRHHLIAFSMATRRTGCFGTLLAPSSFHQLPPFVAPRDGQGLANVLTRFPETWPTVWIAVEHRSPVRRYGVWLCCS
jgi:hypothetical protein